MLLRIALTAVFAVSGGFCLRRCALPSCCRTTSDRIDYAAHVLMSASMIAMLWSSPRWVAWQMSVLAVACGWFVVQATGVSLASLRPSRPGTPIMAHGTGVRLRCLHHAALMFGMALMLRAMSGTKMSMPGMPASTPIAFPLLAWVGGGYCIVVAALLAVAFLAEPTRRRAFGHGDARDDVVHALMTAGMGVMLFAIA